MLTGHGDDLYLYNHVRLNFSSNIPAHADIEELKAFLRQQFDAVSCYPEPEPFSAEHAIARQRGVPAECVLMTNGATEAIYLVAQLLRSEHFDFYEIAQPTFSEYRDACMMAGLPCGDSRADGGKCAFWLCNPNNPTGGVVAIEEVRRKAGQYDMLVVDQSYEAYTLEPMLSPAEAVRHANIIQIHSMTKTCAVPGLRIGYVVAAPQVIAKLRRFVRPWSVNALASLAAEWLADHDFRAVKDMEHYLSEAQRLNRELNKIDGVRALPTATNFMLCVLERQTAASLKQHLVEKHGILIRDASNFAGLDQHYFRVASQTKEENDELLERMKEMKNEE